jgi:aspartate/methionine/tyrosine aminotransferase
VIIENPSYTFSLSGWQLSFCIAPESLVKKLKSIIVDTIPPVPTFIQHAITQAIQNYEKLVPDIVKRYKKSSEVMINGLNEIEGISCTEPSGAIFTFPDISGTGMTCTELTKFLLEDAGVAVLPGNIFGSQGENHIRLTFATKIENINEGLTRFQEIF